MYEAWEQVVSVCVCLHGEMHNFGCGITWTIHVHVHVGDNYPAAHRRRRG